MQSIEQAETTAPCTPSAEAEANEAEARAGGRSVFGSGEYTADTLQMSRGYLVSGGVTRLDKIYRPLFLSDPKQRETFPRSDEQTTSRVPGSSLT